MLQTYEAIYSGNQFRWIDRTPPKLDQEVRVVLVMDVKLANIKSDDDDIDDILERACGAWGTGKTLEEVDKEINEMRSEWDNRGWNL